MTERELAALERRIARIYKEAEKDLQKKIREYFSSFVERDKKQFALMKQGKITPKQYRQWRKNQIARGERFEALRDAIAERYTNANEVAVAYINDETPGIYSLNRNYAAYTIEKVHGNVGFNIWVERTVKRLVVEQPDLMPYYPEKRALKRGIDLAWGKRQITRQVTAGIIQGESIGKIANRLTQKIPSMNRASAIRTARTAVTAAQNGGRMDSYQAAEKMGIHVRKRWIATKDNRTRHEHAMVDGQTVDGNQPFTVGGYPMMYPGDPSAPGHLVYNCRCTMRTVEKEGIEAEPRMMRVKDPNTGRNVLVSEMTYKEWETWKLRGG